MPTVPALARFRRLENRYPGAPVNRLYQPTLRIGEGARLRADMETSP